MKEHIKVLKALGLTPSQAIQFVREVAKIGFGMGTIADNRTSFDIEFSKQLGN